MEGRITIVGETLVLSTWLYDKLCIRIGTGDDGAAETGSVGVGIGGDGEDSGDGEVTGGVGMGSDGSGSGICFSGLGEVVAGAALVSVFESAPGPAAGAMPLGIAGSTGCGVFPGAGIASTAGGGDPASPPEAGVSVLTSLELAIVRVFGAC